MGHHPKKKTFIASEQNTDRIEALREAYDETVEAVAPEDLIFIDETGTNQAMTPLYGRAPKGRRLYENRPVQRGRLYTVIGALGLGGLLTVMTVEGSTVTEVFRAFVEHLLCPHLREGHVVVLDNLPAHNNLEIRELIEARSVRVVFLPPYSPELNPIECAWAKIKKIIRELKPRSLQAIDHAVATAIPTINTGDAIGWFEHCGIQVRQTVEFRQF